MIRSHKRRSIFSPHWTSVRNLTDKWLAGVRSGKLAAIVEFEAHGEEGAPQLEQLRRVAVAAAGLGYSIRIRVAGQVGDDLLQLAFEAGAITLIENSLSASILSRTSAVST